MKTALSLFWLPCLSQLKRWSVQGTGVGLRTPRGEGGGSRYRSLSNRVRGQLQQFGCQSRGQVFKPNFGTFCFRDVHIFPLPLLAMDGTEVGVHQLHDLSQLQREREDGQTAGSRHQSGAGAAGWSSMMLFSIQERWTS